MVLKRIRPRSRAARAASVVLILNLAAPGGLLAQTGQTAAGPKAVPAGGEPLPPQLVMEFQKQFAADLSAKASKITGKKDAQGNLFDSNGNAVSPTTVNGLILTKDTYIADMDGWLKELDRIQGLPFAEKQAFIRQWMYNPNAAADNSASQLMDEYKKFVQATANAKALRDEYHTSYVNTMAIADELERLDRENPGQVATRTGMTAKQWREMATNSPYGWFVTMRQRFYGLLEKNKILALRKDGQYLFEALNRLPTDAKLQQYMDVVNDFIDAGRTDAKQQKADAVSVTSIDGLMKFGGPMYSTQHVKAAALGKSLGAKLPQLEISEVVAVFEGYKVTKEENEEWWNTVKDASLNALAGGSVLIPFGPIIAAGVAVIQISRDGSDLVVSYLTEEEARKNAGASGYQYVITAEDRTAAAGNKLFVTALMSLPDLAFGAAEIKNLKFMKGGKTVAAGTTAATESVAIAAGTAAKTTTAAEAGLEAVTREFGEEVAAGVKAAREMGVPEQQIQNYLKAGRLEGDAAVKTFPEIWEMSKSKDPAVREVAASLLSKAENASLARTTLADMAGVQGIIDSARKAGVPEGAIQAALANAKKTNSVLGYTQGLAHDLQIAEVNAKNGIVLIDHEVPQATKTNLDPQSSAQQLEQYTHNVKPNNVYTMAFDADHFGEVASKVEVAMSSGGSLVTTGKEAVALTREEWIAANTMASHPNDLQKLYKLNTDGNGFMQVFNPGFEEKFEQFLQRQAAQGNPYAQATLNNWNASKKAAAAGTAAKGTAVATNTAASAIPSVLRDPATGGFLKPADIKKLTKEQIAALPPNFAIDEHIPNDVASALGGRIQELMNDAKGPRATAVGTPGSQQKLPATGEPPKYGASAGGPAEGKLTLDPTKGNALSPGRPANAPLDISKLKPGDVKALTNDELIRITPAQFNALPQGPLKAALTKEMGERATAIVNQIKRDVQVASAGSAGAGGALNGGNVGKLPTRYTTELSTYDPGDTFYIGGKIDDMINEIGGDPKAWTPVAAGAGKVAYRAPDGTTLTGEIKDGRIVIIKSKAAPAPAAGNGANAPSSSALPGGAGAVGGPIYNGPYGGARPGDLFAMDGAVREILDGQGFKGDFQVTRSGGALLYTHTGSNTSFEVTEQPGGQMTITRVPPGTSATPAAGNSSSNAAGAGAGGDSGACVEGGGDCVPESSCVGDGCVNVRDQCASAAGCAGSATASAAAKAHQLMMAASSAVKDAVGKVGDDAAFNEAGPGLLARLRRWLPRVGPHRSDGNASALFAPGTVVHATTHEGSGEAQAQTAGDVGVSFVSNGSSTGVAFEVQATDRSGRRRRVAVPEGVVLEPLTVPPPSAGNRPRAAAGAVAQRIGAYCLDFVKLPPAAGMVYKVADQATQNQFRPLRSVLTAARSMATRGLLHPDSNPASYFDSIKQYALWAKRENWDLKKFGEAFVDRTKKNALALKQNWTREMEAAVMGAAPGRWRDITAILAEANSVASADAR